MEGTYGCSVGYLEGGWREMGMVYGLKCGAYILSTLDLAHHTLSSSSLHPTTPTTTPPQLHHTYHNPHHTVQKRWVLSCTSLMTGATSRTPCSQSCWQLSGTRSKPACRGCDECDKCDVCDVLAARDRPQAVHGHCGCQPTQLLAEPGVLCSRSSQRCMSVENTAIVPDCHESMIHSQCDGGLAERLPSVRVRQDDD